MNRKYRNNRSSIPKLVEAPARYFLRKFLIRENVSYGKGLRVSRGVRVSAPLEMIIGENVSIGPYSLILANGRIGSETIISFGVFIVGKNDHSIDIPKILVRKSPWINEKDVDLLRVIIGKDVWIGAGSIILSGVEIGDGAIVAAGSVVTKNVKSCTIVAGNPATYIKERFNSEADTKLHLDFLKTLK